MPLRNRFKIYDLGFKNRGFGLLEVLVAGFIIVTVLSAATFLGNLAIRNSISGANRTVAQSLAQEAMEGARQYRGGNSLPAGNNYYCTGSTTNLSGTQTCSGGLTTDGYALVSSSLSGVKVAQNRIEFTRIIRIAEEYPPDVDPDSRGAYRKVTVQVKWTDVNGAQSVEDISFLKETI